MTPRHATKESVPRNVSRRRRVVAGVLGGVIAAVLFGAGAAFAYWTITDSSNSHPVQAVADSLPEGATPGTPTTTPNTNSNTVTFTFTQATTTTGNAAIPATDYSLKRYRTGGGSAVSVANSCSGVGTITCHESSVPDGSWKYTDTPTYGTNWVGTESAESATVLVDTTPPVNNLTLSGQSGGGSYLSGTTVYYHGSVAGSFTITNALTTRARARPRAPSPPSVAQLRAGATPRARRRPRPAVPTSRLPSAGAQTRPARPPRR